MFHSGDDIGAIVADIGSVNTRIGFAGEDTPKAFFSTTHGILPEQENNSSIRSRCQYNLFQPQDNLEVTSPVVDSTIVDWDLYTELWSYSLSQFLHTDLKQKPVLISEKPYHTPASRKKLCELMFENFETSAFFLSKDSVLSCYANGKTTGLVIDCGGSGTLLSPVHDGWVESRGIKRSIVNSRLLDALIYQLVLNRFNKNHFSYNVNNINTYDSLLKFNASYTPGTNSSTSSINLPGFGPSILYSKQYVNKETPSMQAWRKLELGRDIRETVCRVCEGNLFELESKYINMPLTSYELPDGNIVDFNLERFLVPETFFNTNLLNLNDENLFHYYEKFHKISTFNLIYNNVSPNNNENLMDISSNITSNSAATSSATGSTSTTASPTTLSSPLICQAEPLQKLVLDSVLKVDNELHSPLLNNIILTGGNSFYEGFNERLKLEIEVALISLQNSSSNLAAAALNANTSSAGSINNITSGNINPLTINPSLKVKILNPLSKNEKVLSAFLGGSILGSLGSFHEIWISKREYEEYGSNIVEKKCP